MFYYVDTKNGSDDNNGLSKTVPLKTIDKAKELWTVGDYIYLKYPNEQYYPEYFKATAIRSIKYYYKEEVGGYVLQGSSDDDLITMYLGMFEYMPLDENGNLPNEKWLSEQENDI